MTALSNIIAEPSFIVMYLIAFLLLYLGIVKHYEPLLLIPIGFGVLIANSQVATWVCSRLLRMEPSSKMGILITFGKCRCLPLHTTSD